MPTTSLSQRYDWRNEQWKDSAGDGYKLGGPKVKVFRWVVDAVNDDFTEGLDLGRAKVVRILSGTIGTAIATNNLVAEVQAGNPDGVYQDLGEQLTWTSSAGVPDVATIFDPPTNIRLNFTGTAPTAGALTIYVEALYDND